MANTEFLFTKLNFIEKSPKEMLATSEDLKTNLNKRRTIRTFSPRKVDKKIIENCLLAASSAPSGANKQPYNFVVVSDPKVKEKIKVAAEKEEESFYSKRASKDWLEDLKPFKTNSKKPYLTVAPYLIAIFAKPFDIVDGEKQKNYYPIESTGLAAGTLISSLHLSGLATLTHTPSPLNFLNEILNQPKQYKAMILLVVGYPEEHTEVPEQGRKPLDQFSEFI